MLIHSTMRQCRSFFTLRDKDTKSHNLTPERFSMPEKVAGFHAICGLFPAAQQTESPRSNES
jgi:hypothetical protein